MGLGKTYSADYLIDSNGNTGVSGQVLISTATGIDWADGTAITGGPFLPLSAGSSYPLTNSLYLENTSGSAGASPSLYFKNGSGNFWRYLHESGGDFTIKEGTATKLTFKAGGNVGIGTTSPANKLDVKITTSNRTTLEPVLSVSASGNGPYSGFGPKISFSSNIYYGAGTGNPAGIIETAYVGAVMGSSPHAYATNSDLVFGTRNGATSVTEKMRILGNGNVGIGANNPGARLQVSTADERGSVVNSTVLNKFIYTQVNAHSSTSGVNTGAAAIELVGQADASAHGRHVWIGAEGVLGDAFNTKLKFKIRGIAGGYDWAGSAEAPTIMTMEGKSGNVGIGTASPSQLLHINNSSGDFSAESVLRGSLSTGTPKGEVAFKRHTSGDGAGIVLRTSNSSGTIQDVLTLDTSKNATFAGAVGIGTTVPGRPLTVNSDAAHKAIRILENDTGNESWDIGVDVDGDLNFFNSADTSPSVTFLDNGNVGIGNTSPQNTLHLGDNANSVGGTLRIDSFVANQFWKLEPGTNTLNIKDYDGTSLISFDGANNYALFPGGNVGIGTTAPGAKLDIKTSTAPFTALKVSNYGTNVNALYAGAVDDTYLFFGSGFYYNSSKFRAPSTAAAITSYDSGAFRVFTDSGLTANTDYVPSERMHINSAGAIKFNAYGAGFLKTDANGNITAGAVTTSDTLDDVTDNGNSTTNSITVGNVTSTGGGQMQGGDLYFKNGGDDGAGTRIGNVWYSVSTGGGTAPAGVYESAAITTVANGTHGRSDLVFKTKDNDTANFGSSSERMRITKAGSVGIGDTSPTQISANTFSLSVNSSRTDLSGGLISKANGTVKHQQYWDTSGYNFSLAASSGNFKFTGGNVGIDTTNPATLLHLGKATNGANIISLGEANVGGPHGLDFYGDDATRTKKFSIYYRTGTENISIEDGGGTKRWEISQAGAVTFNQAFTFPTADGSAGAALITNGSGALSWNSGYKQYSPVGWTILNNQTYTSTGANISSSSTQAQAGTTPVQRNSATEFQATKAGWYEIKYSFIVKNNYTNRAMIGAYMGFTHGSGGGVVSGSHSTQYVRYNTYGEYAQIQNSYFFYAPDTITKFYLYAYLLSGSMNMTTQAVSKSMISFRYINNDIT